MGLLGQNPIGSTLPCTIIEKGHNVIDPVADPIRRGGGGSCMGSLRGIPKVTHTSFLYTHTAV